MMEVHTTLYQCDDATTHCMTPTTTVTSTQHSTTTITPQPLSNPQTLYAIVRILNYIPPPHFSLPSAE